MNPSGEKIVEQLRGAETVLVTVSQHPSVDELSAALGLTMHLNEIGKHATAVVSSDIPAAITFLHPEKTFKNSVDSLRDFVISLDKEKADHLRYKLEGDVVKIFITPYKTVITEKDFEYSQGDYNVDTVIAIGVTDQADLDRALESHGKILHDATVATIGLETSKLGSLEWHDGGASSVSELITAAVDALKAEDKAVTEQVASALLTGIVAATERFSNDKTNATAMTAAAKLMAYGANQQLIASKLQVSAPVPDPAPPKEVASKPKDEQLVKAPRKKESSPANFAISHEQDAVSADAQESGSVTKEKGGAVVASIEDKKSADKSKKSNTAETAGLPLSTDVSERASKKEPTSDLPVVVPSQHTDDTLAAALTGISSEAALEFEPTPVDLPVKDTPAPSSTLEDIDRQHRQVKRDEPKQDTPALPEVVPAPEPAVELPAPEPAPVMLPPIEPLPAPAPESQPLPATEEAPAAQEPVTPVLPPLPQDSPALPPLPQDAPALPQVEPAPIGLPPLPPQPDFSALPPLPPQPDFSALPPLPAQPEGVASEQPLEATLPPLPPQPTPAAPAQPADPGQFRIPGQ